MIGHFVLTLTQEQEDRVLTGKMRPGSYCESHCDLTGDLGPCLVGTAFDADGERGFPGHRCLSHWPTRSVTLDGTVNNVENHYDQLCHRFGEQRVNIAIRNRILQNQARRALSGQREAIAV